MFNRLDRYLNTFYKNIPFSILSVVYNHSDEFNGVPRRIINDPIHNSCAPGGKVRVVRFKVTIVYLLVNMCSNFIFINLYYILKAVLILPKYYLVGFANGIKYFD